MLCNRAHSRAAAAGARGATDEPCAALPAGGSGHPRGADRGRGGRVLRRRVWRAGAGLRVGETSTRSAGASLARSLAAAGAPSDGQLCSAPPPLSPTDRPAQPRTDGRASRSLARLFRRLPVRRPTRPRCPEPAWRKVGKRAADVWSGLRPRGVSGWAGARLRRSPRRESGSPRLPLSFKSARCKGGAGGEGGSPPPPPPPFFPGKSQLSAQGISRASPRAGGCRPNLEDPRPPMAAALVTLSPILRCDTLLYATEPSALVHRMGVGPL